MNAIKNFVLFFSVQAPFAIFNYYVRILSLIHPRIDTKSKDLMSLLVDNISETFTHKSMSGKVVEMSLYTPNAICRMRANTFSTKEPETLEWIERFGGGGKILFDIGANIGIYSIYHSLLNGGKTVSFEPSFFNLKQLVKNINLNKCENIISVVPNPISNRSLFSDFLNGSTDEGGALSAFSVDYGFDGATIKSSFKTKVLGFSLDNLFELGFLEDKPNLIKIDVDGIEDLILDGSINTLLSDECVSVLVEVNLDFKVDKISDILLKCGFHIEEELHSEMSDKSDLFSRSFNQIWIK